LQKFYIYADGMSTLSESGGIGAGVGVRLPMCSRSVRRDEFQAFFHYYYFRAQKLLSSGVVEGLNNKAKVAMRKSCGSEHAAPSNAPLIIHLASCRNRNPPTIFSDKSSVLGVQRQ